MNTKITSIAAIMAAGAMAADNERVCCTLYTEAEYQGLSQEYCLEENKWTGAMEQMRGESFVYSHQDIFAMNTLHSFTCGADVQMDVCSEGIWKG